METATRGKAKRRHLNAHDCEALCHSPSLSQPFAVCRTSKDLNRGLYPRTATQRRQRGSNVRLNQTGITEYFPVTGRCKVSPQKMAEFVKMEEGADGEAVTEEEKWDYVPDNFFSEEFEEESAVVEPGLRCSRKRSSDCLGKDSPGGGCSDWTWLPKQEHMAPGHLEHCPPKQEEEDIPVDVFPDACYGLLGSSNCKQEPCGHITNLPEEILMVIFQHLPAEDLFLHISLVCHYWRTIVLDPLFVPWKKLYYQYRKGMRQAVEKANAILSNNGITAHENLCLLNLLEYMSTYKHSRNTQPDRVLSCLKKHPLYSQAEMCIKLRLPELEKKNKHIDAWAALTVVVLLSHTVKDIQTLVSCLRRPSSSLSLSEISEALYCIATLLFAMREIGINISTRLHYNLFYVLHLLENCPTSSETVETENKEEDGNCAPNQARVTPVAKLNLTHEQQQILNHDIDSGHVVKIIAFAGTGKTSTLIKYAEQRPQLRFLYAAFNKSVAVQASKDFPKNVDCKTIHSLAYREVGSKYQRMKKLNTSSLSPFTVAWILPKGRGGFARAKLVTQTLNTFFASADDYITTDHVPLRYKNTHGHNVPVEPTEKLKIVDDSANIWEKMKQLKPTRENGHCMTHDGYLKLWQLQRPRLDRYDAIFIDEAQDCTPAIMDIVLSQSCGKILVGDPHQQIYTFRGAINALHEVPHTHIYYLTQSFRFGPEIAYIGATILDVCKKVKKTLVGGRQEGNVTGHKEGKVAILCRSNTTVFDEAVRVTESNPPPKIHIVGGIEHFGLRKILDIWILLQPEQDRKQKNLEIVDKFIKNFCRDSLGGYKGLKKYASTAEDCELEGKIALVEKYNIRIPELIKRIFECSVSDQAFADFIMGTVHKAKGLEFDTVVVTDDFTKIPCARHNLQRLPRFGDGSVPDDEWNLLYVAVTRARKSLVLTKSIENILTLAGEYFLRSELTSNLLQDGRLPDCTVRECQNSVRGESVLTMQKIPIKYSDREDAGGPFCTTCVEQRLGPMAYLIGPPDLVTSMPYTEEHVALPVNIALLLALF
ncbi:F-box DNA helicase 1 isoform X2 [Amia ocellicauda]|uniref:F-box DNA helicase 1 isoform X2 n=1 Tax=Amia ocellicauda TaxID=2972642 RepID=UPI003463FA1B